MADASVYPAIPAFAARATSSIVFPRPSNKCIVHASPLVKKRSIALPLDFN